MSIGTGVQKTIFSSSRFCPTFFQEEPKHEGGEEEGQRQLGEDEGGGEGGEEGGEEGEEGQDPHPGLLQGGGREEEEQQGVFGEKLVEKVAAAAAWQKTKVLTLTKVDEKCSLRFHQ